MTDNRTNRMIAEEFLAGIKPDGAPLDIELGITEGDLVALHGTRRVLDTHGNPVTWRETHLCKITKCLVEEHWPHVPTERAAALMSSARPRFEPMPVSSKARFIATMVGALTRVMPAAKGGLDPTRTLVANYVERFKNQQKFQVFPKYFHRDFRHHFDFPGQPSTTASFVNVGVNLLAGFPDVHVELIHLMAEGDLVVEHNLVSATHNGRWSNVEATGRAVTWNEAPIYRIKDGRIVENWPAVNFERLYEHIQTP
jgi:predicted ester cyclase